MLTLNTIISNIKKGQSALHVREILTKLEQTYQKLKSSIVVTGCKAESSKTIVFLTIPSETTAGVLYDIVLELHTTNKLALDTKFKVYSNSPAFAYNFSHVFYKNGSLLMPEKYPSEFREIPPNTRNPYFFIGFDKHVFSAIRYISEYGLSKIIEKFNGTIPSVKSFSDKLKEIKGAREELKRSST